MHPNADDPTIMMVGRTSLSSLTWCRDAVKQAKILSREKKRAGFWVHKVRDTASIVVVPGGGCAPGISQPSPGAV